MKTKIVVDSSSNLYTLSGVDFVCVPLKIVTDDGEYLDTAELDAVGMAQTLRSYKGKTGTSCPNVADWLAAYEGAEEVFVVTITGTLSGSYNAAQLAAEEYRQEHEGARVFVLDSLSAGPECRLLAERLAALVQAGCAFDDAAEVILAYHRHTHLLFSLESLANLARNGRVKPAVAAVARMLGMVMQWSGKNRMHGNCLIPILVNPPLLPIRAGGQVRPQALNVHREQSALYKLFRLTSQFSYHGRWPYE